MGTFELINYQPVHIRIHLMELTEDIQYSPNTGKYIVGTPGCSENTEHMFTHHAVQKAQQNILNQQAYNNLLNALSESEINKKPHEITNVDVDTI